MKYPPPPGTTLILLSALAGTLFTAGCLPARDQVAPIERPAPAPVVRSAPKPAPAPLEKPAGKPAPKPKSKPAVPAAKPAEKPVEKPASQPPPPAEKPAEKPVEKTAPHFLLKKTDIRVTIRGNLFAETQYTLELAPGGKGRFEMLLPLPTDSTLTACSAAGKNSRVRKGILRPLPRGNAACTTGSGSALEPATAREEVPQDSVLLVRYGSEPDTLILRGDRGKSAQLRLSCVSFLNVREEKEGGQVRTSFRLPLDFPAEEKRVIFETPESGSPRPGPYVFDETRKKELIEEFQLPGGTFSVLESIPGTAGEAAFAVTGRLSSVLPEEALSSGRVRNLLSPIILWDASLSRRGDHSEEIAALEKLLRLMNSDARLIVFRDRPEEPRTLKTPEALAAALRGVVYDGCTDWAAAFEEAGKFKSGVVLFFGDLTDAPFSGIPEHAGNLRVYSPAPGHGKPSATPSLLADKTGIRTPWTTRNSPEELLEQIRTPETTLESITIDGAALPPEKCVRLCGNDGFLAAGHLKAGDHQLELIFNREGEKFRYAMMLSTRDAKPGTVLNALFKRLGLYRDAGILLPGSAFVILKDPASYEHTGSPPPDAFRKNGRPLPDPPDLPSGPAEKPLSGTAHGKSLLQWLDFLSGRSPRPAQNTLVPETAAHARAQMPGANEEAAIRKALEDAPPGEAYKVYLAMRDKRLDSGKGIGDSFFKAAAGFFFERNDNASAFRILTNLAEIHPASPDVRTTLALHFHFRGEPEKAARLLRKNLEEFPAGQSSAESHYLLGLVLRNSDPAAAANEFSQIWQKEPLPAALPALIEWNRLMRNNEHISEELRPFVRKDLRAELFVTAFRDTVPCTAGPFLKISPPAEPEKEKDAPDAAGTNAGIYFTPPFLNGYWGPAPGGEKVPDFSFSTGAPPETFFLEINSDHGSREEIRKVRIVHPSSFRKAEKAAKETPPPGSANQEEAR